MLRKNQTQLRTSPVGFAQGVPSVSRGTKLFFDDAEYFFLTHDEVLVAVDLDFLAGVLAEQNDVPGFHVERRDLAVLLDAALAGRDDLALLGLFLGRVGDDDPADALFRFFNPFDDDSVVQWSDLHSC